jgi:outer membrane protein OmpA-like peptidoglycan-associated protein
VKAIDPNELVLEEQAMLRKQDSLNRLEELQIAMDTFAPAEEQLPDLSVAERIASLTTSTVNGVYQPALFNVTDLNKNVKFACNDQAIIYLNSPKVKIPTICMNYGLFIKDYLRKSPEAKLMIIGSSGSEEATSLGKRRADFVKDLLVGTGINPEQLQTASRVENVPYELGAARGGIKMVLIEENPSKVTAADTNTIDSNTITKSSTKPFAYKMFTSGYQGDFYYGDQSATSYIASLKSFLNNDSSKKVSILSYTNSVGNASDNMELTKQNTAAMRKLMLEAGIPKSRIIVMPQGAAGPEINNGNRCMIVTVK